MEKHKTRTVIAVVSALIAFSGVFLYVNRPLSLEEHSTAVAKRYITGDISWILDHRIEDEKGVIPKTKNLEEALRTIFDRAAEKFEVIALSQEKGSVSMAQAHTNVKCRSLLHGGTFTLVAPCHLTPEGVRSPLSYFLGFIWSAEYLAENKNPRKDIPSDLEARYIGLQRDGDRLVAAGLTKVSGDGLTFGLMSDWMPRMLKLRKMFTDAADAKNKKG